MDSTALDNELGAAAPDGLEPIGAAGVDRLAALVAKAKSDQVTALDDAISKGLAAVPVLLRRPVKKILFP